MAATSPKFRDVDSFIAIGDPVIKDEVYFPIHTSDFGKWQIKRQRRGDFVVFIDRQFVPVIPPIGVYL
ncbi:DUF6402 family protein [Caballeronia sp. LZ029]|uniref:DUF6402 family protein n=1 Tax=Caballeronia sp. LZ029 TaxID=3038564 RepID=UPI0038579FA6